MRRPLGVVVPAYEPDVERLVAYVETLEDGLDPATVRVELDGADAAQVRQLETALSSSSATVNAVPYRRGKGAAITAGFEAIDTPLLGFVDADGSTTADSFARVVDAASEGDAVLAVGSRRHPDATVLGHQTVARRWLGDGFAWLARRLTETDLYDYQCGAKALSREAWEEVRTHLYEPGFAWDIELVTIAAAVDLQIREVPITWEDESGSTVDPVRTPLRMGRALLAARHRAEQIRDSPLHTALASGRSEPVALVEQE